jgi:phage terminase large subunit
MESRFSGRPTAATSAGLGRKIRRNPKHGKWNGQRVQLGNVPGAAYGRTGGFVIPYTPRPQFEAYHDRTERFAKIVAHRRFGKTVGCINDMIKAALTNTRQFPPPRFAYIAPTYSQAKDVAWGYLKHFSADSGLKMSESELWVEYPNGARIRLYGADNYDRMRGLYHDGVTIDEPAQMDPRAWPEVIRPTLSDYSGWGTFIGTPEGPGLVLQDRPDDDWAVEPG